MTTAAPENPRIIALFDVDGTLTIPRGEVEPAMMDFMMLEVRIYQSKKSSLEKALPVSFRTTLVRMG
jgi:hypothetical protein